MGIGDQRGIGRGPADDSSSASLRWSYHADGDTVFPQGTLGADIVATLAGLGARRRDCAATGENCKTATGHVPTAFNSLLGQSARGNHPTTLSAAPGPWLRRDGTRTETESCPWTGSSCLVVSSSSVPSDCRCASAPQAPDHSPRR